MWPFSERTFDNTTSALCTVAVCVCVRFFLLLSLSIRFFAFFECTLFALDSLFSDVRRARRQRFCFVHVHIEVRKQATISITCADESTMSSMAKNEFRTLDDKWSRQSCCLFSMVFRCCCCVPCLFFNSVVLVILQLCHSIVVRVRSCHCSRGRRRRHHDLYRINDILRTCRILHIILS